MEGEHTIFALATGKIEAEGILGPLESGVLTKLREFTRRGDFSPYESEFFAGRCQQTSTKNQSES